MEAIINSSVLAPTVERSASSSSPSASKSFMEGKGRGSSEFIIRNGGEKDPMCCEMRLRTLAEDSSGAR